MRILFAMLLGLSACSQGASDRFHDFAYNYAMIHAARQSEPSPYTMRAMRPPVVTHCRKMMLEVTCWTQ